MSSNMTNIAMVDHDDSFTANIVNVYEQLGYHPKRFSSIEPNLLTQLSQVSWDLIVLGPGPQTPLTVPQTMACIEHYHRSTPLLGLCLGHQCIGTYFGHSIQRAQRPYHGETSSIDHNHDPVFTNIPNPCLMMQYHANIIQLDPQKQNLKTLAWNTQHELMAFNHTSLPIYGFQFHPESFASTHGKQLLSQHLNLTLSLEDVIIKHN